VLAIGIVVDDRSWVVEAVAANSTARTVAVDATKAALADRRRTGGRHPIVLSRCHTGRLLGGLTGALYKQFR